MKFLKRTVVLALIACLLFTVVIIALSVCGVVVPDTLIQYFFIVFGTELAATSFIKIADTVVKRAAVKTKIEDMKKDGITPERSDYKVDSDINSYDYNDYGG
ncbi:unknown [Clostridium sp. CAG:413]|nr:unknown [Clostridium sp. CAG:413]